MTDDWNSNIPAVADGARDIATLAAGVMDVGLAALAIPGAGLLSPTINFLLAKRIKRANEILIEEIAIGNSEPLRGDQAEEFVPIAFRFFEAARVGETEAVLRMLACFIRGQKSNNQVESDAFSRCAAQLAGFSQRETLLLAEIANYPVVLGSGGVGIDSRRSSMEAIWVRTDQTVYDEKKSKFYASCAFLAGRGLLVPRTVNDMSAAQVDYEPTPDSHDILKFALQR